MKTLIERLNALAGKVRSGMTSDEAADVRTELKDLAREMAELPAKGK